jgi:polyhydroxybutyrate depolymerase
MDQQTPIFDRPPANGLGVKQPQDGHSASGLDLVTVAQLDQPKASEAPSINQFLAGLDQTADKSQALLPTGVSFSIPLNHHYLDSDLVLKSLEVKNPSYTTTTAADGTRTLDNIRGLSLTFNAFGKDKTLAVKSITINKDDSGNRAFSVQIDNPLPPQTQKVFNTPDTLPLTFSLDRDDKISLPKDSELFYSLSTKSNTTFPGMALQDALNDAGSVAQFIEAHPAWVNNIMEPFMKKFGADLRADLYNNPAYFRAPTDTTRKIIGHIVEASAGSAPIKPRSSKIQGPGDYHETMKIDGRDRTFTIHVPPGYDPAKPMPLMVLDHGLSQTGESIEQMIGSNAVADKKGFIVVYPDSVNWFDIPDLRTWDTGNGLVLPGEHSGDIQFMDSVINTAKDQLNVDPMRVFMVGHSNGGMMAYATAGALSGELAGVGILSSAMSGNEPQPKEPLSMFNVHGTADAIIPIGGITDTPPVLKDAGVPIFQPAQYGTDYYKKLDGITDPYTITRSGDLTTQTASNPANGTAVEQITIDGAGHIFNNTADMLERAFDFLNAHPRLTPPNPKDDVIKEPDTPVENLTTVHQLKDDLNKRGINGLEQDVDNVFDAARTIADNTISPSAIFDKITKSAHVNFNDPVSRFIQNTTSITKKQDQITIDRKIDASIPVYVPFGVGTINSVEVSKTSFDMTKLNGYPELKNISGITLHAQVAGYNLASKIDDITELPDGNNGVNGRIYRATMQNPLPGWMRTVLLSPGQFNVDLKFDANRTPYIVNQNTTERQLLGKNPWVNGIADEAQDAVNLKDRFNLANTFKLASDAGITAGATYLGFRLATRLGGTKAKIVGALCFVAAPMAIDFIRKELAP